MTESDAAIAIIPLLEGSLNKASSLAIDTLYSRVLNGCQMKAANGSGRGDGGVQSRIGSTFDCVLSWTAMITDVCPATESPKWGKKHLLVDRIHPDAFNCEQNLVTARPS